ncbi:MAG: heavy metal-binding domain-containing protein, partial [Melioribacteraceae bacterium]|nr:heavy metal-binding domain-containing protein [Melioribacteraceae bacterium]
IIAIDLDYEALGQGSMLMVTATGTAVLIEE